MTQVAKVQQENLEGLARLAGRLTMLRDHLRGAHPRPEGAATTGLREPQGLVENFLVDAERIGGLIAICSNELMGIESALSMPRPDRPAEKDPRALSRDGAGSIGVLPSRPLGERYA